MIYTPCHARCWRRFEEHTPSSKYFQDRTLEVTECTLTYKALAKPHNPKSTLSQAEAWWP